MQEPWYVLLRLFAPIGLEKTSQASGESQRFFLKNTGELDDWKIQSHFNRYGQVLTLSLISHCLVVACWCHVVGFGIKMELQFGKDLTGGSGIWVGTASKLRMVEKCWKHSTVADTDLTNSRGNRKSKVQEVYSRLATTPYFPIMFSIFACSTICPFLLPAKRTDSNPHCITAKTIASIRDLVMSCLPSVSNAKELQRAHGQAFLELELTDFFNGRNNMGWTSSQQITNCFEISPPEEKNKARQGKDSSGSGSWYRGYSSVCSTCSKARIVVVVVVDIGDIVVYVVHVAYEVEVEEEEVVVVVVVGAEATIMEE